MPLRRIELLELRLEPPKHGWLPFRIAFDDFVIEDAASNVLNDPLASLFDVAAHLAMPTESAVRACLWLEPGGYAVDAEPSAERGCHSFRVFYHDDFVPPMRGRAMSLRLEVEIETQRALRSLLLGLASLLRHPQVGALDTWLRGESVETYQDRLRQVRALSKQARPG